MADGTVERVKALVDLVELIGESVQLTRKGKNWWGCCPFHNEKTPSFTVNPERGSWHCFGCGKGGDAFSFVMEKEGATFREALELLAARVGVELPRYEGAKQKKPDLYALMEKAANFFRSQLVGAGGKSAQAYLSRRNVSDEIALTFELGWAPDSWSTLTDALSAQGVSDQDLLRAGLSVQGNRGLYDRFRARVMFPIRDLSGRVIAFGGRLIEGDGPKYLNSAESDLYQKKSNLYLLHRAKTALRERGRAILVEGYMDALRLQASGFNETVASLGTALTMEQAKLIKRFCDQVYICYDSDAAGQQATLRGMYELSAAGLGVKIVTLPSGKDPDEFLQKEGGVQGFQEAMHEALDLVPYHLELYKKSPRGPKEQASLLAHLATLPHALLAHHRHALHTALLMKPDQFDRALAAARSPGAYRGQERVEVKSVAPKVTRRDPKEVMLLSLLWHEYDAHAYLNEMLELVCDPVIRGILQTFAMGVSRQEMEASWRQLGDTTPLSLIGEGDALLEQMTGDMTYKAESLLVELRRKKMSLRYEELQKKMMAEEATNEELAELVALTAKLRQRPGRKV